MTHKLKLVHRRYYLVHQSRYLQNKARYHPIVLKRKKILDKNIALEVGRNNNNNNKRLAATNLIMSIARVAPREDDFKEHEHTLSIDKI